MPSYGLPPCCQNRHAPQVVATEIAAAVAVVMVLVVTLIVMFSCDVTQPHTSCTALDRYDATGGIGVHPSNIAHYRIGR